MNFEIGKRIQEIRKSRGITQEELAKAIGVQRSAISKYESDMISPTWEMTEKILDALNITWSQFLLDGIPEIQTEDPVTMYYKEMAGEEINILRFYRQLNLTGKAEALKRIDEMTHIAKYIVPDEESAGTPSDAPD